MYNSYGHHLLVLYHIFARIPRTCKLHSHKNICLFFRYRKKSHIKAVVYMSVVYHVWLVNKEVCLKNVFYNSFYVGLVAQSV